MKSFYQKVKLNNRKAMIRFLDCHTRYYTVNSANGARSYANCVKLFRLGIPRKLQARAYAMLEVGEVFQNLNGVLEEWGASRDWVWQVKFAGPNRGHLVLYSGGLDYREARTAQCDRCGFLSWHREEALCTMERCKGTLRILRKPRPEIITYYGVGIDDGGEFSDWSLGQLQDRVLLVQEFDLLCDSVVEMFLDYCRKFEVVEKEVKVAQRVRVLKPGT